MLSLRTGLQIHSLSGQDSSAGSMAGTAWGLGTQIRQNCQASTLARRGHQIGYGDRQSHGLGSLLGRS